MCNKPAHGLTLIELMVFIVVVGIAANAMLGVFSSLTRSSANLLPDKQAQAVASSLMNEILAQPFTFCDPDDVNSGLATTLSSADCADPLLRENNLTFEAGETRNGVTPSTQFDNVNDYNGYMSAVVSFPNGSAVVGLSGYTIRIAVASAGVIAGVPASETLIVTVTVTPPSGAAARLEGVRIRYAPTT